MLAFGLLINIAGIGIFCWLIFALAVYAVPFFVAMNAGIWAYHTGAGPFGTGLVAVVAGGLTLAIGQIAFSTTRSLVLRAVISAVFALPATFAGYHVVLAMAQIGEPSFVWRQVLACVGAIFIGGAAWARLAVFTQARPVVRSRVVGNIPRPALSAATREEMISSVPSQIRLASISAVGGPV